MAFTSPTAASSSRCSAGDFCCFCGLVRLPRFWLTGASWVAAGSPADGVVDDPFAEVEVARDD